MTNCVKEAPFRNINGSYYKQIDCVAIDSPLGPIFANFYMGYIKEEIFQDGKLKPYKYGRYVDDIFIIVKEQDDKSHQHSTP